MMRAAIDVSQSLSQSAARTAGWAGIFAGLGLAVETGCWLASGWKPEVFADPAAALELLRNSGQWLRAAALAGFINLALEVVWLAGLTRFIAQRSPFASASALYFGLIAIAGHALVPVGLWLGVPTFVQFSSRHGDLAAAAWAGFSGFQNAAGGVGSFFAGLFMVVAGFSAWSRDTLPKTVSALAILAGACSLAPVLGTGTPWQNAAGALYMPGLLLVLAFRVTSGTALLRSDRSGVQA